MLAPNNRIVEEAIIGFSYLMADLYVCAFSSLLYYVCEVFGTHVFEIQFASFCLLFLGQIDCNHQTCCGKLGRQVV